MQNEKEKLVSPEANKTAINMESPAAFWSTRREEFCLFSDESLAQIKTEIGANSTSLWEEMIQEEMIDKASVRGPNSVSIEPLAICLGTCTNYCGIERGNTVQKMSLYADDLLLYVANPTKSIPIIMGELNAFGKVSGYKLNLSKSVLFPIGDLAWRKKLDAGVEITSAYAGLFKEIFGKLLEKTSQGLQKLSHLPLSLAGHINIIKMNILPKYMFMFQCIVILIKNRYFQSIDSIMTNFIWKNKTPRIKKAFLQKPKAAGGMGLPDLKQYYWACNTKYLQYWLRQETPAWLEMEKVECFPSSPLALLLSPYPGVHLNFQENLVVLHSLKFWFRIWKLQVA